MILKKIIAVLLISLVSIIGYGQNIEKMTTSDEVEIISMLNDFYKSYTEIFSYWPRDVKKEDILLSNYCTNRLLKENLYFDSFIGGVDCNPDWLKTLKISKDDLNNNTYKVSYTTSGYVVMTINIKLLIIKEGNNYKIDYIL